MLKILLVVYDNESYIHWFPQGLAYIAAVLKRAGHNVTIYSQDLHHYPDEHLTEYLDANKFDVVGVSVIGGYYQFKKIVKLSAAINNSKNRPYYIIGGHGPAPEPDFFLKVTSADVAIIGEGEETIIDLLNTWMAKRPLKDVKGIAFRLDDQTMITPRRDLIQNIDSIPWPAYELFPIEYYRLLRMPNCSGNDFILPLLSGRGCPFTCNFCYRMDPGFRARSNDSIIEEILFLKKRYGITYIAFSDELLMSSESRTTRFCEDLIKREVNVKWDCNGRLNFAKPDLLMLMKKAGCVFINYGIECFDNTILKNMNKILTTEQISYGIEATLASGISPGFNIIFGNIDENEKTLQQGVDFLLKYDDGAQMRTIRPVTPYPGTPLYDLAKKHGLIKDAADFYFKKHLNSDLLAANFTKLTDNDFYDALSKANIKLINAYFDKKKQSVISQIENLYKNKDSSFRGFRHT